MARAAQDLNALVGAAKYLEPKSNAVALGIEAFDAVLPDGGLPRGQVTEVAVQSPAQATSLALWACRAAQREAKTRGSEAWCAFIDPSQSLFAPALGPAGVDASKLLVVRPLDEAVDRVAVKLAEAQVFSVVVIDLVHAAGAANGLESPLNEGAPSLSRWEKIVRRLSVAIAGTATQVILLTDLNARRALPLPVALRLELQRPSRDRLRLSVAKDKFGRVGRPVALESDVFDPNSVLKKAGPRLARSVALSVVGF
jgi:recombination protein RecA